MLGKTRLNLLFSPTLPAIGLWGYGDQTGWGPNGPNGSNEPNGPNGPGAKRVRGQKCPKIKNSNLRVKDGRRRRRRRRRVILASRAASLRQELVPIDKV